MSTSNELRVFISSTFRDLQEEREHLVKKIFPEIRAICRERGVTFTDIDLRWGLTDEEAMLGRTIRTCLEEIDRCRPYFIGMIGDRYGWIPAFHEIMMDPDLLSQHPWIEEVALSGVSVTEIEFIHGAFDAPKLDAGCAFFYRRVGDIANADDPERLALLIERTRATGRPFHEFTGIEEFGGLVRDDLIAMIDRYWPQHEAPSELELERRSHAAFAASRTRAYIPNPEQLKRFNAWVAGFGVAPEQGSQNAGPAPLVISADSGLGKSSLVAYLTGYYRKKSPASLVIEHYVGASQSSGSAVSVMRHVIGEICERFRIGEKAPANEEALTRSFSDWLFRCDHLAGQAGVPVLIVIDAVNQLSELGRRLGWLPTTIPRNIMLMVSTTPGETRDLLMEREWESLIVAPLDDERVRQSIVVRYLGEFHKGITPEQVRRVTSDAKASSPLFLRIVAEELRLHGDHETLDNAIDRYTAADGLLGLFDVVLERIERDYGVGQVRDLLSATTASRAGLSESELMGITGLNRLELSRLLFAFDYHLLYHDGLVGFFHDYLQRAVEARCLGHGERPELMRRMAAYFKEAPVTARSVGELVWLYRQLDDVEALVALLRQPSIIGLLGRSERLFEMLGAWKELLDRGVDPIENLRRGLEDYGKENPSPDALATGYDLAANVLADLGLWNAVRGFSEEALARAEAGHHLRGEAMAEFSLGRLCVDQGRFDEALRRLQRARQLFEQIGDVEQAGGILNYLGIAYTYRGGIGDSSRAMECYREELAEFERRGEHYRTGGVLHNIGVVCVSEGRIDEGLDYFERAMRINTSVGNLQWLKINLHSIGEANSKQGRYDRALDFHEQALKIAERLIDRNSVGTMKGAIGLVYVETGEYDKALTYALDANRCFVEMGDHRKAALTFGLIGQILARLGAYDSALEYIERALGAFREMGAHTNLALTLQILCDALLDVLANRPDAPEQLVKHTPGLNADNWRTMTLKRTWDHALELVEIASQLQNEQILFDGRLLLARIRQRLQLIGNDGGVVEGPFESLTLQEMLATAVDDSQRAELHYWLGRSGSDQADRDVVGSTRQTTEQERHQHEALRLYRILVEKMPKHDYRKRIEELEDSR